MTSGWRMFIITGVFHEGIGGSARIALECRAVAAAEDS
jgi:hypothetical protein